MTQVLAHDLTTRLRFPTVSNIVLVSFTLCRTSLLLICPPDYLFSNFQEGPPAYKKPHPTNHQRFFSGIRGGESKGEPADPG